MDTDEHRSTQGISGHPRNPRGNGFFTISLFGDRRYARAFIYHNGAQSYYDGRGFRASLRV